MQIDPSVSSRDEEGEREGKGSSPVEAAAAGVVIAGTEMEYAEQMELISVGRVGRREGEKSQPLEEKEKEKMRSSRKVEARKEMGMGTVFAHESSRFQW